MPGQSLDFDWRLRLAAFDHLKRVREHYAGVIPHFELTEGFEFEGERIALWSSRQGIWRPRQLGESGAALSIVTIATRPGRRPPYDDQVASERGEFIYRYQGTDPTRWTNASVRRAMELGRPLIYFYGLVPGTYEALFPAYVQRDDPADLAFHLAVDAEDQISTGGGLGTELELRRAYATVEAKRRLHQHKFRQLVLGAYQESCAICRLKHSVLLDAAHILPDKDERGRPEIPNGLALCKIHHGAFDALILGISPDYRVHINADVLKEKDGPMLRHGLQEMDGERIHVPRAEAHHPRRDYLEERFDKFQAA